ncbi:hypothetical protein Tco_0595839 [Tanacetum coccineum]
MGDNSGSWRTFGLCRRRYGVGCGSVVVVVLGWRAGCSAYDCFFVIVEGLMASVFGDSGVVVGACGGDSGWVAVEFLSKCISIGIVSFGKLKAKRLEYRVNGQWDGGEERRFDIKDSRQWSMILFSIESNIIVDQLRIEASNECELRLYFDMRTIGLESFIAELDCSLTDVVHLLCDETISWATRRFLEISSFFQQTIRLRCVPALTLYNAPHLPILCCLLTHSENVTAPKSRKSSSFDVVTVSTA